MGKIACKIVSDGANVSGGLADYDMLYPFVDDIVVVGVDVTEANVSGGILPITQATATALGVGNPIIAASPAAYYQFQTGVTVTGSGVSQWTDQSGNARHLLQGTDANRPAYDSGTGILTFNGGTHVLNAVFAFAQPITFYLVVNQISWTATDRIVDGQTDLSMTVQQTSAGVSPQVRIFNTSASTSSTDLVVGSYGVLCAVFNGASSVLRINNNADITANLGTTAAGGIALGNRATGVNGANIGVKEGAFFSAAHTDAERDTIISYLMTKFSI